MRSRRLLARGPQVNTFPAASSPTPTPLRPTSDRNGERLGAEPCHEEVAHPLQPLGKLYSNHPIHHTLSLLRRPLGKVNARSHKKKQKTCAYLPHEDCQRIYVTSLARVVTSCSIEKTRGQDLLSSDITPEKFGSLELNCRSIRNGRG
jgi:hypothetical protein